MADIYIGNIKGPQGAQGETGAQGPQGDAATIEVGTVSTTAYGNTAQVINTGTSSEAVFDFVIPQGRPGEETTTMSSLTLDTVTAQSAQYPVPATGESGSVVFGKIIKFFNDIKTAIVSKINYSDCVYNLTSTSNTLPLAASQGKALNDALGITTVTITGMTGLAYGCTSAGYGFIKIYDFKPSISSGNIGTLPSALYPRTRVDAIILSGSNTSTARITLNTNGQVSVSGIDTSQYYYGQIVFPLA